MVDMVQEKKHRNQDKNAPFIVAGEPAFKALPHWLREREGTVNIYSTGKVDKFGNPIINVGHDTKPNSVWGGKYTWLGGIVVRDRDLLDRTEDVVIDYIAKQGNS